MKNFVLFAMAIIIFSGCSYVGVKVPDSANGCQKRSDSCSISDKNVSGSYRIKKNSGGEKEFSVDGEATLHQSTGEDFRRASFTLLLLKRRVIVAEVGMTSGSGKVGQSIQFHGSFDADFDESIMDYHVMVR